MAGSTLGDGFHKSRAWAGMKIARRSKKLDTLRSARAYNAFRNNDSHRICSRRFRSNQCQSLSQMQRQMEKDEQEETFVTKPLVDQITPSVQRQIEEEWEEELLKAMSIEKATLEVSNDL